MWCFFLNCVCAGPSGIVGKAIVSLCDNLDMTYYRKSQRGCHTVPIFTVCGIWNYDISLPQGNELTETCNCCYI